jgi:hypothetical protein
MPHMSIHQPSGLIAGAVVATALATGGCHVSRSCEPTSPTVAAQGLAVLKSLPSFEDT